MMSGLSGTYGDPANAHGMIPPYLFDTTDASTYIFDYLATYNNSHFFAGDTSSFYTQSNWTIPCSSPSIFLSSVVLFLGCLLYPNVTGNAIDASLPSNLTDLGFLQLR
jgi:hypothetical protein